MCEQSRATGNILVFGIIVSLQSPDSDILALLAPTRVRERRPSAIAEEVVSLFDQTRAPLLRYVLNFNLPIADGEEIVQEVFLALVGHLDGGKPRHNLRGWLFRVAHNLALKKRLRSRCNIQSLSGWETSTEAVAVDPEPNPEARLALLRKNERVQAVLNILPERDRRCLALRAEGLRYREIAEVLDISLGGVSLSLARSLRRIAQAVER